MLSAEDRELRKTQLGASEIHKIMNFDNKGARDLWKEKVGIVEREQFENAHTVAGNVLEQDLLEYYFKSINDTSYRLDERVEHSRIKNFVSSTDGLKSDGTPVECKTVGETQFDKWGDSIPKNYYLQVQTQILCTRTSKAVLVAFVLSDEDKQDPLNYIIDESKMHVFEIKSEPSLAKEIESRVEYFLWCMEYKREPRESDYYERMVF